MDQQLLKQALDNGCSEKLAEMLASRSAPGLITDTICFSGVGSANPYGTIPPDQQQAYYKKAIAAGVNPKGKKYLASLAAYPGDPEALVDSRGDAKRLLEKRGWGSDGMVKTEARQATSGVGPYTPAEDIVEERATAMLAADGCDGTCTVAEWSEAKEKATESLSPKKLEP